MLAIRAQMHGIYIGLWHLQFDWQLLSSRCSVSFYENNKFSWAGFSLFHLNYDRGFSEQFLCSNSRLSLSLSLSLESRETNVTYHTEIGRWINDVHTHTRVLLKTTSLHFMNFQINFDQKKRVKCQANCEFIHRIRYSLNFLGFTVWSHSLHSFVSLVFWWKKR